MMNNYSNKGINFCNLNNDLNHLKDHFDDYFSAKPVFAEKGNSQKN